VTQGGVVGLQGGVLGWNKCVGEAGGDWGVAGGFLNEIGWPGLGSHQLDCPSIFGLKLGSPYGVAGLSSLQSGGDWAVGTCERSLDGLGVWGVRIEVA